MKHMKNVAAGLGLAMSFMTPLQAMEQNCAVKSYSAARGYDLPTGNDCRARYNMTAYSDSETMWFFSDGRDYTWRTLRDGTGWTIYSVEPELKSSFFGIIDEIEYGQMGETYIGTIESGYCGTGWIVLSENGISGC